MTSHSKLGLFEYLAEPISSTDAAGTRHTEREGETYDDDAGLGSLGTPAWRDGATVITRTAGETYDDDGGHVALGIPHLEGTRVTLVDAETYDDDPGLGGLGKLF